MNLTSNLELAREWLSISSNIAVLTGAGISAESGVPTFRGTDGLWKNFRAEELATPEAFKRDPTLVWEWYNWRREVIASKQPNPGHMALAALAKIVKNFTLITQNVDGLHDLAGNDPVLKLHGDIWSVRCTHCHYSVIDRTVPLDEIPPVCNCGNYLRPDIVWFGEALPQEVLEQAWIAAEQADLFLVIGTSALVQPAASLPLAAKSRGAKVIEVNRESTPLSHSCDISLVGQSGQLLPALLE